jgi:M6 family metalloprotease-like protein
MTLPASSSQESPFKSNEVAAGLMGAKYSGYFDDDLSYFKTRKPNSSVQNFKRLSFSRDRESNFSYQWTGYFKPTKTGIWELATTSDDASYVWLGKDAIVNFSSSNVLMSAPGIHAPIRSSASQYLLAGAYYPIRIQYGEKEGLEEFRLFVKSPGGKFTTNLSGLVFHNPKSKGPDFGFKRHLANRAVKDAGLKLAELRKPPGGTSATSLDGLSMSSCEAPRTAPHGVALGFPRSNQLMPSVGQLRGVVIFVEFNDVRGDDDPLQVGRKFTEPLERFYRVNSYGKLEIKMTIMPKYYRINKTSASYGMTDWNSGSPERYFSDAVNAADKDVDYSQYDFVVVLPPAGITDIVYGPAFPELRASSWGLPAERSIYRGTVGGADQRGQADYTGWVWLGHEIGHVLGMEHQYNSTDKPSPVWDLMDMVYIDVAPSLFSWHRYQMGWLEKSQLACFTRSEASSRKIVLPLSPLDSQTKKLKSVMVRLSETRVLAIEARVNSPIDKLPKNEQGLLVYIVDTSLSGKPGPIKLAKKTGLTQIFGHPIGTMQVGESVSVEGFEISYIGADRRGYWVEIDRK